MSWLVDRLTPYKQSEERWRDLARALEEYWDTYSAPALERIEQMRSVFTAHDEDIEMMLSEAGIRFEVAVPLVRNHLAFAYTWRAYEIHRKDRQGTLEQILARDYAGAVVRWMPLFAPRDAPYGTSFLSSLELEWTGVSRSDVHHTYRGKVLANLTGLTARGIRKDGFRAAVRRKIDALRPAHIVYDGEMFFQVFLAEMGAVLATNAVSSSRSHTHLLLALSPYRFDELPADTQRLDHQPFGSLRHESARSHALQAWDMEKPWRLDMGSLDGGEYLPLGGIEGDELSRCGSLGAHRETASFLGRVTLQATFLTGFSLPFVTRANRSFTIPASASADACQGRVAQGAPARTFRPATPKGPRLDDVPADFAPLDMTYEVATYG